MILRSLISADHAQNASQKASPNRGLVAAALIQTRWLHPFLSIWQLPKNEPYMQPNVLQSSSQEPPTLGNPVHLERNKASNLCDDISRRGRPLWQRDEGLRAQVGKLRKEGRAEGDRLVTVERSKFKVLNPKTTPVQFLSRN